MPFSSNDSENAHHLLLLKSYYCNHLLDNNDQSLATQSYCCFRFSLTLFIILSTASLKKNTTKIPQTMLPTPKTRVRTEREREKIMTEQLESAKVIWL